jgi:hypothetical protein
MTADPTSYSYSATFAALVASGRGLDPVRARVIVRQQLTNDQILQADAAAHPAAEATPLGLHLPPDTRGSGRRGPHPGDVLYWVACLGGACLLLIAATR